MSSLWSSKTLAAVLFGAVLTVSACAHRQAVVAPEPQSAPAGVTTSPAPEAPGGGTTTVAPEPRISPAENPEGGISTSELPADLEQINKAGYLKDAFFDTNKSELRPDARDVLAGDAAWLKGHPTVKVSVEGHCDERNTEEYNLALGWRRANAVKDYLVSLGVGAGQLTTISYGEEKPFATCHDESCWSQNRRVHFVVTAR
ncbi:MAG: peptidoglycan-associated lipoprotein Pal [Thermoanaerobaculaceae bacterium]|nr:peptidoglycan-associated lipoprotein Pal [Thermoanaerobaculaceae bacterium]